MSQIIAFVILGLIGLSIASTIFRVAK
jgi:hypothetical protein